MVGTLSKTAENRGPEAEPSQVVKEIEEEQAKNAQEKRELGRRISWKLPERSPGSEHDGVESPTLKKAFSHSKEIIQGQASSSLSSVVLDASGLALSALPNAAQYASTPYLRNLASISSSILNAIKGAKANKDSLKQLASTITSLSDTVAGTYHRLHPPLHTENSVSDAESKLFSSDPMLNQQVEDLLSTLREIEDVVQRQVSRTLIRRVISSRSDSNIVQDYKDRLNQVLEKFTLRSNMIHEPLHRLESKQEELLNSQESVRSTLESFHRDFLQSSASEGGSAQRDEEQVQRAVITRVSPIDVSSTTEMVSSPIGTNSPIDETRGIVDSVTNYRADNSNDASASLSSPPYSSTPIPQRQTQNVSNGSVHGNITIHNISGNHTIITHVDNSRRENFENVYHIGGLFTQNEFA
ncbi:hypothetical protein F5051DRAFT_456619 [Lentinula edodes]|nr:hypothetical protein F5051DRAFT_456619 [Lentinula edodes]